MAIDYSIEDIIKSKIRSHSSRINKVEVEVLNTEKRSIKIVEGILVVGVPEHEREEACNIAKKFNENYNKEDFLGPIDKIYQGRAIENFKRNPELEKKMNRDKRERQRQRRYKSKKLNKKRKRRAKIRKVMNKFISLFKKFSSNRKGIEAKKRTIKGFAGLAILVPGMIFGAAAASKNIGASEINYETEQKATVEHQEGDYEIDEQVKNGIESLLKDEISKATGAEEQDISFESEWIDSKTKKTVLNVGDKEYRHIKELEGVSTGNLSGELADLISAAQNAESTEALMNTYIRVKNFSESKDLKVEGNNLVEVDSKEDDFER